VPQAMSVATDITAATIIICIRFIEKKLKVYLKRCSKVREGCPLTGIKQL
jgi:hypothetical protein